MTVAAGKCTLEVGAQQGDGLLEMGTDKMHGLEQDGVFKRDRISKAQILKAKGNAQGIVV